MMPYYVYYLGCYSKTNILYLVLHDSKTPARHDFPSHAPSFSAGGGRSAMRSGHALRTTCQVSKNLERNRG